MQLNSKIKFAITLLIVLSSFHLIAQDKQYNIRGQVLDYEDNSPIIGATIQVIPKTDSTTKLLGITDFDGNFSIEVSQAGEYILKISYIGFSQLIKNINTAELQEDYETYKIKQDAKLLEETKAIGTKIRVEQQGDTTVYNADAYKVNPDADAEDLISKMPGFTKEDGEVKVHGEVIKKVTVDGKDFFGDDATAALKNLPAELIDKVQVFDEQSEQSKFTGFDDGNSQKTINIVTKGGLNQAQFGKVYAGYGTQHTHAAGFNLNFFGKDRRISLIGMKNNINIQNFSSDDIMGVMGSSGGGRGAGGGRGGGRGGFGGGNARDFMVGQQNGISSATSLGINYTDKWTDKININASYFANQTVNRQKVELNRELFMIGGINQFYYENSNSTRSNTNHRLNLKLTWNIDSFNSIIYTPRISLQLNDNISNLNGENSLAPLGLLNFMENGSNTNGFAYTINNNLLYRKRTQKQGRTFSANLRQSITDRNSYSEMHSLNEFYSDSSLNEQFEQNTGNFNLSQNYSINFAYTEPINNKSQLMFNVMPSYNNYNSNRMVSSLDIVTGEYNSLDTLLSSNLDNIVTGTTTGIGYSYRPNPKLTLNAGLSYQYQELKGIEKFPDSKTNKYIFPSILPNARANYKIDKSTNLMFSYRAFSRLPSINQLQKVVDNNNPMQLSSGNETLNQETRHFISTRFGKTNIDKGTSFMIFMSGTATQDYITNASWIAKTDNFEVQEGIILNRGAQFSKPINLDGYKNARTFASYGIPFKKLKVNMNLNAGYSITQTPGLINDINNNTLTHNINSGIVISSNISEQLDFTVNYTANFNNASYSFNTSQNNNYFFNNASLRLTYMPLNKLVLNSETYYTGNTGLARGYNQNVVLWNMGIGYKFLKNNRAELRLSAYDILNNNNSVSRIITENYIQDSEVVSLRRFFLVTFTYQIRNFKSNSIK